MPKRSRVQVLLNDEERESFRRQARAVGNSLSAWLRGAGLQRLVRDGRDRRLDTVDKLDRFFEDSHAREADGTREPDWEEHLRVMRDSRRGGLAEP